MLSLALAAVLATADPTSTNVALPAQPAPILGTMLTPGGETRAAAVIIAGSGPTDRNGNSPMGVSANSYRLLAEGLAAQGIATVRYDKRGIGASFAAGVAESELRFGMLVDDARAWAAETARLTGRPCAWLIGHSEGSLIALAAAQDNDLVCGVVSLSGAGRSAPVVLSEQLRAGVPEPLLSQALHAIDELAAGRTTDNVPGLESLFRPSVQPYIISWFALDPQVLANLYPGPLFIGQGSTDFQTTVADAEALKAAQPDADLVIWEGVNHVLKVAPEDRAANAATYGDPTLPLAPGVVDDIAEFILIR
ncbi:MAG TPA: alpha/beta fold hydrolase [Brevundimonas sp.]